MCEVKDGSRDLRHRSRYDWTKIIFVSSFPRLFIREDFTLSVFVMTEENKRGDGVERWDFSWQGSTSAPLDYPPSEESWDTNKWSNESRKQTEEEEKNRMEKQDEQDMKRSLNLMGLGTLFVVGAISANVFTFQRSRWAVGKEIHRAWQRRQSYNAQQEARAAASKAARNSRTSNVGNGASTGGGGFAHAAREAAARAAQTAARAAAEQAFRAASKAAKDPTRKSRIRGHWQTYSQSWSNDGTVWRTTKGSDGGNNSGQQAFDAEDLEELLRQLRGERPRGNRKGEKRRDVDDLFEEMMRGFGGGGRAQRRSGNSHRNSGPTNLDGLFEEMFRVAQQASEAEQRGGFSGGQNFWEQSQYGPGVHTRGGFGTGRHYSTLGLENGADKNKVKAAYRKLVMKYHPDRYSGNDKEYAANKFREITQAYEALTKNM